MAELVSIVIPTYNRARLVTDALDSAVAQTWRPIEIIVVDDGSDDGTEEAVTEWAESMPSDIPFQLLTQDHSGGNAARNLGVAKASGDFVAFLDSDDVWFREKLEKQMAVVRLRPACGAVYCGVREVDAESGEILSEPRRRYPEGRLLDDLLVRDVTAPTSTCLVRRAIFDLVGGFDIALKARQDWDLWIRLGGAAEIGCVPEPLVDMRHHAGPRTISDPTRELVAHQRIMRKYGDVRRERGLRVRLAARASYHRRAGRVHLRHLGGRWTALGHYAIAIVTWPFEPDSYAALLGWFLPDGIRGRAHRLWNRAFGTTKFAIRSH